MIISGGPNGALCSHLELCGITNTLLEEVSILPYFLFLFFSFLNLGLWFIYCKASIFFKILPDFLIFVLFLLFESITS